MLNPLKNIKNKFLLRNSFVRKVAILAGGTAMAQIITICAMPFVARIYSPEQIGILSIFQAFFGYWASTLSLRYESAFLIAQDDVESHFLRRLAIILIAVMSLISMPVLWLLQVGNVLGFGLLPRWAPLIATPIFFGYGIFMLSRSWALRAGLINKITQASIVRSSANALARIGLGLAGGGVSALFFAELAGAFAAMAKLTSATAQHYSYSRPMHFKRGSLLAVARKYSKFPLFEAPSAWLDALALALPLPMIASLYGAQAAGWFGLALMIVSVPNSQIGAAVADVFQMEFSKAVLEKNTEHANRLFYSLMKKMALVGIVPLLCVIFLAPWLVPLFFGEKWGGAGEASVAISPWIYAALIVSPLSRILSILRAQEVKLIYDSLILAFMLVVYGLAKFKEFSFLEFLFAISSANIIGYVIYAFILSALIKKRINSSTVL